MCVRAQLKFIHFHFYFGVSGERALPFEADSVYSFLQQQQFAAIGPFPFGIFRFYCAHRISFQFGSPVQPPMHGIKLFSRFFHPDENIKSETRRNETPKNRQSFFSLFFLRFGSTKSARKLNPTMFVFGKQEKWRKNISQARTRSLASALKFYLEKQVETNPLKDKEITKSCRQAPSGDTRGGGGSNKMTRSNIHIQKWEQLYLLGYCGCV